MNRESAKKWIKEITAFAEGKTIQGRFLHHQASWCDEETPRFECEDFEFRIKPVPMRMWHNKYGNDINRYGHDTEAEAIAARTLSGETIEFVQVIK